MKKKTITRDRIPSLWEWFAKKKFHTLVQAEEQAKSASHNGIKAQVWFRFTLNQTNMARSSFIIWKSKSVDKYFELKELINIFIITQGRYSYRRITDELNNQGVVINHKTILG
jgi:hypothetical protein